MNGWRCRVAEKLTLCCLLFVVSHHSKGQNLVPNGSFELKDTCPYTTGFQEGDQPLYWRTWLNSPEYFNACADASDPLGSYVDVPQNGLGFQYAQDGEAYVGYYAFDVNDQYREYIGVPLTSPLIPGNTYYASFWVNIASSGLDGYVGGECNNMGLLFSMHSNAWMALTGPDFAFRNYAQLYRSEVLTDTANWTLVSGSFVADSAYQYVVLGNFFDNAHTDVVPIPPLNGENAYCFIDNVCVSPNPSCDLNGIDEITGPGKATVWVNGATDELIATWPGHAGYSGEVVDMAGRRIGDLKVGANQLRLSVPGLSGGMYVVWLKQGCARAFVKFVIPR